MKTDPGKNIGRMEKMNRSGDKGIRCVAQCVYAYITYSLLVSCVQAMSCD